jgi:error-prone DNA polymerase
MFTELLARSCFSFLRGASQPEELVERARQLGLGSLALCDRDGLYGTVRAWSRAKLVEQRVAVGAELSLSAATEPPVVALLARDHDGYRNLCRLLTLSHADRPKGESVLELDWLARHHAGLVAVVPAPRDPAGSDAPPPELFARLRDVFGEHAFIAAHRHLDGHDAARIAAVVEWSRRFGLPVVASARPLFHEKSRKPLADVLWCIRNGATLDRAGTAIDANAEACLRSELELRKLFRDHPDWVDRAGEVGSTLRFQMGELC